MRRPLPLEGWKLIVAVLPTCPPCLAPCPQAGASESAAQTDQARQQATPPGLQTLQAAAQLPNAQVLRLVVTVIVAVVSAAWVISDSIAKVDKDMRQEVGNVRQEVGNVRQEVGQVDKSLVRFEAATTATLQHHSTQLVQLSTQMAQLLQAVEKK
ncbi:hypothetical protein COHA_002624 [Chlorella ohadii]|uniref:Uncharacterized protein n=1 Tax=Chlorella ohadii TaxID=2649997 RepID=A0AAD5H4N3_9CHLO|nr:hypothetical protein COHA_002624 [Chlorella ohadii]